MNALKAKIKRIKHSLRPIDKRRKGECLSCGRCCKLVFRCPFLTYKNKKAKCSIYKARPVACRKYPRCPEEFVTEKICGFRFE